MNKSELQKLFDTHGIRPNKRLGQCFLIDDNLAGWIVRQVDPQPEDVVIEVGPGAGALTRHLYGKVRRLILIEMDRKLAGLLRERFPEAEVIEAEVLSTSPIAGKKISEIDFPEGALVGAVRKGDKITRPLADTRIEEGDVIAVFVLTKDVAQLEQLMQVSIDFHGEFMI